MRQMVKISVLLCTYRPYPSTKPCFDSLDKQDFGSFEVLLVSQTSGLSKHIGEHAYPVHYKTFHSDGTYRPCRVRNYGIYICEGKLVFFLHDFTSLDDKDFLTKVWEMSQDASRGVSTKYSVIEPASMEELARCMNGNREGLKQWYVTGFTCCSDAVPLVYLKEVNGFDEEFDGGHGYDDFDLKRRLEKAGCSIHDDESLSSCKIKVEQLYPLKYLRSGHENKVIYDRKV